ncbi:MAG: 3-hydroxybutyryl-CoA dehydrogenase [Saprospiraceae bacterium]|nr:3-hydroxybutyryl-CoA dehydrogenase [Saprospiraceae bacterium]
MQKVAVIGAGTMGNGIAHVFAQHHFSVVLVDLSKGLLDQALSTISKNLDRMVAKDRISAQQKVDTLLNVTTSTNLQSAVADSDLVIEAVSEKESIKKDLFGKLSVFCPSNAILASNTSSISITRLASYVDHPERVIGMHFMNPVPVMKLIEVIRGHRTSDEVAENIMELGVQLGKEPVVVNDYPGFISNRILMPMINEAIYALHEGVGTKESIDAIMRLGMAHPMGPIELADFVGLDVCLSILKVLYEGFGNPRYAPCPLLVNMVNAGLLGRKSGKGFYQY